MTWWKQALLCLLLLGAAAVVWYRFFPGAAEVAAEWGIGEAPAATAPADEAPRGGPGRRGGGMQSPVVATPVTTATINDRLTAIGTGNALRTVAVRPFTSGRLTEVSVEPGAEVEAGEIIARLDSETESIAVDRAELALDDARARLERISALRSSNTVTAVQQTEVQLEVRNAELALREARLALERREIVAPIGGFVGILPVAQGDYVTSSDDIATIDDRSQILVDFWVPERYAGALAVGMPLTARSIARPDESYTGTVRAIDNKIDQESRTLRVQGRIDNPADTLRSGMAFRVSMAFAGETYPAVDPLAVQWGTEGAYVWVVRDGVARRTPVRIIQRNSDSVLVDGAFAEGDQAVVEGVHAVREGQGVSIAGNESQPRGS
ncbi:efflux RND transporter periplasmic adaptor subunit [Chelativorans salis]|uniref:Efflux RND transporter periplasmic adaptor subunit n=1 Tax=Chelativorans salis TaxID=2978478 RepID=A0ABT2LSI1_9HYPH|nr:efflux RND transporter periplasmic adaptor subunit [Chelativorans sp. EGI FJ00035]MCT7377497.1 efflux RND transporter periplasmic adaptor subunit [Chelativorans sp. EGI FJ00035]